ncbi:hypothetical protein N2152v2_002126 [Parachlorella kessleri]
MEPQDANDEAPAHQQADQAVSMDNDPTASLADRQGEAGGMHADEEEQEQQKQQEQQQEQQQQPGETLQDAPQQADVPQDKHAELWAKVRETPGDFASWTSLVSAAEQADDIQGLREVFDAFLAEFPLCFGYWKKYAEAEARHGQLELAGHVYERGVAAVPYSVDMWAHYCTYRLNSGATQEEMEGLFERAAAYVGADYNAHGLWDRYLRYEHNISNAPAVAALYTRILALPLRDLDRYHSEFQAFARDRTAAEMATPEEAEQIRAELEAALRTALEAAAAKKRAAAAVQAAELASVAAAETGAEAAVAATTDVTHPLAADAAAGAEAGDGVVSDAQAPVANGSLQHSTPGGAQEPGGDQQQREGGAGQAGGAAPMEADSAVEATAVEEQQGQPALGEDHTAALQPAEAASGPEAASPAEAANAAQLGDGSAAQEQGSHSLEDADMAEAEVAASDAAATEAAAPAANAEADGGATANGAMAAERGPSQPAAEEGQGPAPMEADGQHADVRAAGEDTAAAQPAAHGAAAKQQHAGAATEADGAAPGLQGPADGAGTLGAEPPVTVPDIADADIKRQWVARREAVYKVTKEELARRVPYESALRRPYFHVKPMEPSQLAVWARYLDYSEACADDAATVRLYERCLVACANYPEFWMRYIRYLDGKAEAERSRDALTRAATLYCKRSPQLALFAARRSEIPPASSGDAPALEAARAGYDRVASELAPALVQCTLQRANFERRQGDVQAACRVFEEHIAAAAADVKAAERGSSGVDTGGGAEPGQPGSTTAAAEGPADGGSSSKAASYAFLVVQYAHFLQAVLGQAQRAQQVYREALERVPHCRPLWEGAVHLETVLGGEGYVGRVLELYERASAPPTTPQSIATAGQEAATGNGSTSAAHAQAAAGPEHAVQGAGGAVNGGEHVAAAAGEAPPGPAAAAASPAGTAEALGPRGLSEADREELSERMVAFADLHGRAEDLHRAEQLHYQRFKLPLALAGRKRGGADGGSAAALQSAKLAGAGEAGGDAAAAAAAQAAMANASSAMGYYGSAGYYGGGYGAGYGSYGGYYSGYY